MAHLLSELKPGRMPGTPNAQRNSSDSRRNKIYFVFLFCGVLLRCKHETDQLRKYYKGSLLASTLPSDSQSTLETYVDPRPDTSLAEPLITCDCRPSSCYKSNLFGKNVTVSEFWQHSPCTHSMASNVVFFHAGKGGGGTIESMLENNRIAVTKIHPYPQKLNTNQFDTLILNVRDPVDRLVSAFQWRQLEICLSLNPREYCHNIQGVDRNEIFVLRTKYNSDPNVLAESLCVESPHYVESRMDVGKFGHSQPYTRWLQDFIGQKSVGGGDDYGIKKFMVVPMTQQKGGDTSEFERGVEELVFELLRDKHGYDMAKSILTQKPPKLVIEKDVKEAMQHSTSRFFDNSLSPLGECCMTRFLENDFRLIRTMVNNSDAWKTSDSQLKDVVRPLGGVQPIISEACSWGSLEHQNLCRSDLISILQRRLKYLDRSQGSCAEVTNSGI